MKPKFVVYSNNDQAILAWQYEKPINNCIGFSIFRKHSNESDSLAEPLFNKVGFENQTHQPGEERPSTEWPIQRFTWADFSVNRGDVVMYKNVPMLLDGDNPVKDDADASDWSDPVTIDTGTDYQAYFNRGLISSQFFNFMKTKYAGELSGTTVKAIIGGDSNKVRDFLGGYLSQELFQLLDTIAGNENMSVYGALYELQQRDLIEKLKAIGKRAHIILSNGSFKLKGEDKNSESREELKDAGVDVYDRIVAPQHFGHNKFLVICENDQKTHVWTGSTNWTPGGLFSQVNNGIYIPENPALANVYYSEWERLRDAGDSSTDPSLLEENANSLPGKSYPHVWFSPKKITGDINDVSAMMDGASQGILFLMFNPGPRGTLFNKVLDLQAQKPDLFIRGVINQDPGGANHLIFFHRGNQDKANWSDILPDKISKDFGYWDSEESAGMVTIHSKVMVIDPFTDNAAIVTGSNNFGPKASQKNDDNLIIIRDKKLAREYTVNILAVYDHYRWRYSLSQADPSFSGLKRDPAWMRNI